MVLHSGRPFPLGATPRDGGVNFAVVSEHATEVELCLFDGDGNEQRLPLSAHTEGVWHGFLPGAAAGQIYGYRMHGPYEPHRGHRFNPHKLLLDPYAREIVGRFDWDDAHFGYQVGHPDSERSFDRRNNAAVALKARVAQTPPAAASAPGPHVPVADTVLYELHVKGFSRLHVGVPEPLRGTYAGLAHPASITHLTALGVTTVALLPVHFSIPESRLRESGLTNYWGYNTIGYFCPDPRLSSTPLDPTATGTEFRAMVDRLHEAGLEVVLDVVYNHTAEGDERGPTISFRGLDNALYYRLVPDDRARYENWTGCGNTVNVPQPRVTQLVLDSLRYWAGEMGVDGFRFDLGVTLGRTAIAFDPHAAFFVALLQDPTLAHTKLIAEPWDLGPDGYQLGRFPGRFMEWNDRFRDSLRRFWLQRGVGRGELVRRIAGSSDRFHHGRRLPCASVNYVTSHDGFTLTDLVSYSDRHNEANGEANHDGHPENLSTNCGVEGPTDDADVNTQRARLKRALLVTLLTAQGTPMLLAGDEIGHTQRGNNNAYCQDNDISWLDWSSADMELLDFVRRLLALRRAHPHFRVNRWLSEHKNADGHKEIEWLRPDGEMMTVDDWHDESQHGLAVMGGDAHLRLMALFNAEPAALEFTLPAGRWRVELDSARPERDVGKVVEARHTVDPQSVVLFSIVV
jgi:glycogen operon protein